MNLDKQAKDALDEAARAVLAKIAMRLMTDVAEAKVREILETLLVAEVDRQLRLPHPVNLDVAIRAQLKNMTADQRVEALDKWFEGYCIHCGDEKRGRSCTCMRDE